MDKGTAQVAAAAYMEGYQQCLEDVMREGVEAAQRIADDEGMGALMAECYSESPSPPGPDMSGRTVKRRYS